MRLKTLLFFATMMLSLSASAEGDGMLGFVSKLGAYSRTAHQRHGHTYGNLP